MKQRARKYIVSCHTQASILGIALIVITSLLLVVPASLARSSKPSCYAEIMEPPLQTGRAGKGDAAFAEAKRLQAEWKADSLRRAIKKYAEAQLYWSKTHNTQQQIQALKNSGDVYRTLSDFKKAIATYSQALKLIQTLKNQELESEILNNISSAYIEMADSRRASEYCNQAYELSRRSSNRRQEAQALNNIGLVHFISSEMTKALDCFNKALLIWQDFKEKREVAEALINIGYTQGNLGETQQALSFYDKALSLWQAATERYGQARALTAIGGIYSWMGETQKALNYHNQALKLFRSMGNRNGEAATLNGIGYIYDNMGDRQKARDCYLLALRLYQAVGNQNYAAITMGYVGRVHAASGERNEALKYYNEKLIISRKVMDNRMEAYTLKDIGSVFDFLGDKQKALDYYNQALMLSQNALDRRGQAYTLNNIGDIYDYLGDKQKAFDYYNQALKLVQTVTDRKGEILILYNLARLERNTGRLNEARARIEDCLKIVELLRNSVLSQSLRASYLASVYQYYEFYIDLLMRLYEKEPSNKYNALAFEVSEHARARTLLEVLAEARADIRQGVDSELLEQERRSQQRLNEKAERQMRLLSGKCTVEEAAATKKDVEELLAQFQSVQVQVREKSPRYAALTQPAKMALPELQKALDKDTLLLEYSLGSESSYVWAVTESSFISFSLPKRSEIEGAARGLYGLVTGDYSNVTAKQRMKQFALAKAQYPKAASELSRILLGPVAALLQTKRLIIVADGVLQYVPFAALPEIDTSGAPARPWQPLIIDHEIINLPSLSTLVVLREQLQGRTPAKGTLAVLADPVYEKSDPRIRSGFRREQRNLGSGAIHVHSSSLRQYEPEKRESLGGVERLRFQRLPFSSREASAIMALAPKGESLQAIGVDANRTMAMNPELGNYRIVHFATHGSLDSVHPDLSAVVLSLVDEQGHQQDGFLRLNEVYNLHLPVELVVLSACETGLGKNIRGEGLISLTRGFMYAGARRIIASLWNIDDRAAAELMKRFYVHLLGPQQLPAAAALRAAQIEMWKDYRWEFPFFWAAFTLQGEWR